MIVSRLVVSYAILFHQGVDALSEVTLQYFYDETTVAESRVDDGGCEIKSWNGTDAHGMSGPPWLTTIQCNDTKSIYKTIGGRANLGFVTFFLAYGSATIDNEMFTVMGDSYWLGEGAVLDGLEVNGESLVYILGSRFALEEDAECATPISSSFLAPRSRVYRSHNGSNTHDAHIGNGTTNARDLVFSRGKSNIDPPLITVLNCAWDYESEKAFVWYHNHPAGAVYLPFTGRICFYANDVRCATPGYPRWVAPNLFYYEDFKPRPKETAAALEAANALVQYAFDATNASRCTSPIIFAVTNFDPDDTANQPNFDDQPNGTAQWGYFKTMTVHKTTVFTSTTTVLPS